MAHLEFSPVLHDTGLVLGKTESKIILPLLKRAQKRESKHIDRLLDIQESGEATERQQTQLVKHQEKFDKLTTVILSAEKFVKI